MNRDGIPRIRREGRGGTWKAQGGCDRGQDSPHTPSYSYQTHNRSIGSFGIHTTFIAPPPFRRPTKVTSAPRLNRQRLNASTPQRFLSGTRAFKQLINCYRISRASSSCKVVSQLYSTFANPTATINSISVLSKLCTPDTSNHPLHARSPNHTVVSSRSRILQGQLVSWPPDSDRAQREGLRISSRFLFSSLSLRDRWVIFCFLYLHLCYQPGGDTGIVRCERVVRVCTTRGTLNIESRYLSVHKTTGRRWIPRPPSAIQTLRRSHSMPKPGSPEKPPKPGKRPRKGRTDEGRSGGQTLKKMNFEGKKTSPCAV